MKKYIIRGIFHLVALGIAVACLWYIYLYWTGAFFPQTAVAFVTTNSETTLVDKAELSKTFSKSEYAFLEAECTNSELIAKTNELIEQGAEVLIFDLSEKPETNFEIFLTEQNLPVIFTDALPSEDFFANSDKAWYFNYIPAFAGELLGKQIANGFKNGEIADLDQDIILDYYAQPPEQSFTPEALTSTLTSSEQYGVYVSDTAIIIPETSIQETEETEIVEDEETSDDESDDEAESGDDGEEPEELDTLLDEELLPKPEVVISIGVEQAVETLNIAKANNWLEGENQPMFTAIVDSFDDAVILAEQQVYYSFVYLDVRYTTENLTGLVFNLLENQHITQDTDLTISEDGGFTTPYRIYP